ncbi:MAG: hypothetical protein DRI37_02035 [Chloroflexi bacterium]|nr:MAG: hypothetical protein DRI37_02035 [Chloroflexota bacterium]
MNYDLQVLAKNREALLLAEVAAWLHNLGKLDPHFLVMQTGESPNILNIYRICGQYSFRRFTQPSVLIGHFPYQDLKGVFYFVDLQIRREIQTVDEAIQNIQDRLDRGPNPELGQEFQRLEGQRRQKEANRDAQERSVWQEYEQRIEQRTIDLLSVKWPIGSLLTMFWESEWFDRPSATQPYEPGASNDPDYQRQPKPNIRLKSGLTMELPALLLLSHGEISGQEKKGLDAQGRYVEVEDYKESHQVLERLRSASVFGYEKPLVWQKWVVKRKQSTDWIIKTWNKPLDLRGELLARLQPLQEALGDTQRPINEISLWDYSKATAALFKTAIAQAIFTKQMPTPANMRWRLISVRLDALDFLFQVNKLADLIARRQLLDDSYQIIRHLLEVEIPIGSEVYADEHGIIFVLPELPGWSAAEIRDTLTRQIYNALDNPESLQTLPAPSVLYGASDVRPAILVGPVERGKKLKLKEVLPKKESISVPPPQQIAAWWQSSTEDREDRCTICGLRPEGYIESGLPSFVTRQKAKDRHLCGICLARRGRRAQEWAETKSEKTIWIDEVADVHGRVALVVGRFDLDDWLDGTLVRSLAIGTDKAGIWLAKPPTFVRIHRVWRTTKKFWDSVQGAMFSSLQDDRRRLLLWLDKQPDLGDYHAYELDLGSTTMSMAWIPPRKGQKGYFISTDNLEYVAKQLGAEKDIYEDAASSAIFVEDFIQREFVQKGHELVLHNPECSSSERKRNLLRGCKVTRTEHQDRAYSTAIPILAEPRTFMALVPADRALEVIKAIKAKYEREMGKVRNRLPLTLGAVYFGRRTPLAAALDAGRRMLRVDKSANPQMGAWKVVEEVEMKEKDAAPKYLQKEHFTRWAKVTLERKARRVVWRVPLRMGDGETEDCWYPYIFVKQPATDFPLAERDRKFQAPYPWVLDEQGKPQELWLVHAGELKKDDVVYFTPSTCDFEYLDTTARRFEVSYDGGQRRGTDKRQRPYLLEELEQIEQVWADIQALATSQIKALAVLIETKRQDWQQPTGDAALALPEADPFRQFCCDALKQTGVYSETLERAALSGMLNDTLELHLTIRTQMNADS